MGLYDRAMVKDNHLVAEDGIAVLTEAITRLKGVQMYNVPSTRIGVSSNAVELLTSPSPSDTSPWR